MVYKITSAACWRTIKHRVYEYIQNQRRIKISDMRYTNRMSTISPHRAPSTHTANAQRTKKPMSYFAQEANGRGSSICSHGVRYSRVTLGRAAKSFGYSARVALSTRVQKTVRQHSRCREQLYCSLLMIAKAYMG